MADNYYREKLSASKLLKVYDIAPPRVRRYLEAETAHAASGIEPGHRVIELGCGYGRVLRVLAQKTGFLAGIDNALSSLFLARNFLAGYPGCRLVLGDAVQAPCLPGTFDRVVCIQNGISAFHRDPEQLIREAVRIARPGGIVMFSSYAAGFWEQRLEWFRLQAKAGLLGEIDEEKTGDGVILCKDGFTATTMDEAGFLSLTRGLDASVKVYEVDGSSLFCEITKKS